MGWSHWNGAIWAFGNGLASTLLITYLALELGAGGLATSLIFAAPQVAGALRLITPWLIEAIGDRRSLCLCAYLASGLVLFALPALATPGWMFDKPAALATLIWLWCLYHLLEYIATVSLYSWLGDLAPRRLRGRFFGRRETFLLVGRIAGMLAAAGLAWAWQSTWPLDPRWFSYALPACLGAVLMTAATLPLVLMASPARERRSEEPLSWTRLLTPLSNSAYLRFLAYSAWFSFSNGITQAAQNIYPAVVLRLPAQVMLGLQSGMRLGQSLLAPATGAAIDSRGYRPVMIASQLAVSLAPLGYFLATREAPWWIVAAWVLWIGYVGLNVALPAYTIALAPRGEASAYLAIHQAIGGVVVGLSTVGGGLLHDYLGQLVKASGPWQLGEFSLDHWSLQFLAAICLRAASIAWLLFLLEPPPRRPA